MSGFALEAEARLALDVAFGTAEAMGDEHCGTEHLLFGLVATATDEFAELAELFALDIMRVERALVTMRAHHCRPGDDDQVDAKLTTRAEIALCSRPMAGDGGLGGFDLLLALLSDPRSGAATVLRSLGVRIGEIRRLAELGAARLDRVEIESLIAALDRRDDTHRPWWGPANDGPVARIDLGESSRQLLARSETAVVTLDAVVAGPEGFGITITISSCDDWLLPPRWEPDEELVPGVGAQHRGAPDGGAIDLRSGADDQMATNRAPGMRWRPDEPSSGSLVLLGNRTVVDERNDRRRPARRSETSEWWVWPLPADGPLELHLDWPAEAVSGTIELDADEIRGKARSLRTRRRS